MLTRLLLHYRRTIVQPEDLIVEVGALERRHLRHVRLIQALQVVVQVH